MNETFTSPKQNFSTHFDDNLKRFDQSNVHLSVYLQATVGIVLSINVFKHTEFVNCYICLGTECFSLRH